MWPRLQIDLKYLLVRQVLLFFFLCRSLIFEFQRNRRENQINNKTNDWNVLTTFPVKINTKNRRTVLICVAVMWQKTIKIHPHVFIFRFVAGCFFSAVFFCYIPARIFFHVPDSMKIKNSECAWCLLVNHWALLNCWFGLCRWWWC